MYIIKNALKSITRNKGRNLLIGIIVIVIACAATISLAIITSATSLIKSYENKYDIKATIGVNREQMRGEMQMDRNAPDAEKENRRENMNNMFNEANNISIEDINNYGNSEYVKDYYYQISTGVNSDTLEKASMEEPEGEQKAPGMPNGGRGGRENFQNIQTSDFTLTGYSSLKAMEDFINGQYKIVDGEISSDITSSTCIINTELATLNDIATGDEVILVDPADENNKLTLAVTGLFDEAEETDGAMGMFTGSVNNIITNTNVINNLKENNEDLSLSLTPTFILTSKDVVDKFSTELTEKGLSEYLSITTNLDEIEGSTKTVDNVKTFAMTFLIITLIIGAVVLFVINMINIRERKYEIGVLRTIGMKKSLLSCQFIIELIIVSFFGLLIGAGLGAVSSVPVSNYLLENEQSNANVEKENINQNFGGKMGNHDFGKPNGVVEIETIDSIDAAVNIKVLVELLGIGLLLTLISGTASMISIERFSPLTILKERS